MYETAQQPTLGRIFLLALLDALLARPAAAILPTLTTRLFTAGPTPITPNNATADFTEATFNGYAEVVVTPGSTPVNTPSGEGIALIGDANFIATGAAIPETILGYYVVGPAGSMLMGEYFPAPVPIVNPGDFISLNLSVPLSFSPTVAI